jgi:hypothetical protein
MRAVQKEPLLVVVVELSFNKRNDSVGKRTRSAACNTLKRSMLHKPFHETL